MCIYTCINEYVYISSSCMCIFIYINISYMVLARFGLPGGSSGFQETPILGSPSK